MTMKCIIKLELTDYQRNALARHMSGRDVKRLATRDDFRSFVKGCIDMLTATKPEETGGKLRGLTPEEERDVESLRNKGWTESQIRGWITAGRVIKSTRAA